MKDFFLLGRGELYLTFIDLAQHFMAIPPSAPPPVPLYDYGALMPHLLSHSPPTSVTMPLPLCDDATPTYVIMPLLSVMMPLPPLAL